MRIPEQCVILVGGLGKRLGSLTANTPKPLLSIGHRPFLEYLLMEAARFGFKEILLLAGYQSDRVTDYLARSEIGQKLQLQINILTESEPAGTGGALWLARDYLQPYFFVLNGDSWFDFNWLSLITARGDSIGIIGLRKIDDVSRYGVVEMDGPLICRFAEKTVGQGPGYVNSGVYLLSREIGSWLSPECSLERDVFPKLVESRQLQGWIAAGRFLDIGIPKDFETAERVIPSWQRRPAVFLDRDGTINEDSGYVHKTADFRWLPGAVEGIRLLNDAGFYVFVVTNQAGIAHGFYPEQKVEELHAWVQSELRSRGAHIDDFRFCPYHPDGALEAYRKMHPWRKPAPGMIEDLINQWPVDISRSLMIGDKDLDIAAGHAAGIQAIKVGSEGILPHVRDFVLRNRQ